MPDMKHLFDVMQNLARWIFFVHGILFITIRTEHAWKIFFTLHIEAKQTIDSYYEIKTGRL